MSHHHTMLAMSTPQLGIIPRGRPHCTPWYAPPAGSPTRIPGRPSPLETHPHCRQCAVKQFPPGKGTRAPHRAEELRFLLESSARLRKAVGGLFTPRVAPHSPDTWPGFHLGLHPGSEIDVLRSESDCNVGEKAPLKCKP